MQITRRDFMKISGAAVGGLALGGLGFDLAPVEAQAQMLKIRWAKESTTIPVLRKDFIIDEAQVYESRLAGADAILLIVRALEDRELIDLLHLARELGLQALVEVHNAEETERALKTEAKVIGINNRDLDTFKVDLQTTIKLHKKFPKLKERIVISESGIATITISGSI